MRRALWLGVGTVVLVIVLFLAVFPVGTYLGQRSQLRQESAQLARLRFENRALASKAAKLQTNGEIERIAREDYGLVKPGQEAYVILPAPSTTVPGCPTAAGGHAGGAGGGTGTVHACAAGH